MVAKKKPQSVDAQPSQLSTSSGAVRQSLLAYAQGATLSTKPAPLSCPVTRLWTPLIQPNRRLAGAGYTGSDAALMLCILGYGDIAYLHNGKEIILVAGSTVEHITETTDVQADNIANYLAAARAWYHGKKPYPTSGEFAKLVDNYRRQFTNETEG